MGRRNEAVAIIKGKDTMSESYMCVLLQECITSKDLNCGRMIQSLLMHSGVVCNALSGSYLICMFAVCGSLVESHQAFEKISWPSLDAWNSIISAHASFGKDETFFHLYNRMQVSGIKGIKYTYITVLKACSATTSLRHARIIHLEIIEFGLQTDLVVSTALMRMYSKCGNIEETHNVFYHMPHRDVIAWNTMIVGYTECGKGFLALECFEIMHTEGRKPDEFTYSSILKACGTIEAIHKGRFIHEQIIQRCFKSHVVGNAIVDMYAKCGSVEEALTAFDKLSSRNLVAWNAMVACYAHHGKGMLALECFNRMYHESIRPNEFTFSSILKACGSIGAIEQGRLIWNQVVESGFQSDIVVGSSVVDMYARCGSMVEASKIFDKLSNRNAVTWGAMMTAFASHEKGHLALSCYGLMQLEGIVPNKVIFLSMLKACGSTGAIREGKLIHHQILVYGIISDVVLASSLIDMYVKCGGLDEALIIFGNMANQSVVSWNAMIAGYAHHSKASCAIQCLMDMEWSGIKLDGLTFNGILACCSRAGLADEGHWYFEYMIKSFGIQPDTLHYNCMIDLLGGSGCFKEAECLARISIKPNESGWRSLLNACTMYGNLELARKCFEEIARLDSYYAGGYVQMSNLHAYADMSKE